MSADQSPISFQQLENGRNIQDFSPVILEMPSKIETKESAKHFSQVQDKVPKINFYPQIPD